MQLSFADKSVVVQAQPWHRTGDCHEFAQAGASVAICARGKQGLDAAVAEIARHGTRVHGDVCDLGDEASTVHSSTARLQRLVASTFWSTTRQAGAKAMTSLPGPPVSMSICWEPCAQRGPLSLSSNNRAAARSSTSVPFAGLPDRRACSYAAVKAAIINYTISEALVLSNSGIRVNAIAPGSIEFPGGAWRSASWRTLNCMRLLSNAFRPGASAQPRRWRTLPVPCQRFGKLGHRPGDRR